MRFEKWEACGNDFVVVSGSESDASAWAARAATWCDRHTGVGADGILLVDPTVPSMTVVNADGSYSEMCGNGIRCVVGYLLYHRGPVSPGEDVLLRIRSGAGWHDVVAQCSTSGEWLVSVDMGTPSFEAGPAHFTGPLRPLEPVMTPVGEGHVASIGNPHWVFLDADPGVDVGSWGPRLEHDERFLRRTNVEFVTALPDGSLRVRVWERGVGLTQACGSGAVCVTAVAVALGRSPRGSAVAVHLPGGTLTCTAGQDGSVVMKGPARRVFAGEWVAGV